MGKQKRPWHYRQGRLYSGGSLCYSSHGQNRVLGMFSVGGVKYAAGFTMQTPRLLGPSAGTRKLKLMLAFGL